MVGLGVSREAWTVDKYENVGLPGRQLSIPGKVAAGEYKFSDNEKGEEAKQKLIERVTKNHFEPELGHISDPKIKASMIKAFTAGSLTVEIVELIMCHAIGASLWCRFDIGAFDEEDIQQAVSYLIEKGEGVTEANIVRVLGELTVEHEPEALLEA